MKYITLIIGLLVVGCGKQEQADTNESTPTTTEKPAKELTLEEKVVGTYEAKNDGDTYRGVLLENGVVESYINDKQREGDFKWSISEDGELHVIDKDGDIEVYRTNKDGSITNIAIIDKDGKRKDTPKDKQVTVPKIK